MRGWGEREIVWMGWEGWEVCAYAVLVMWHAGDFDFSIGFWTCYIACATLQRLLVLSMDDGFMMAFRELYICRYEMHHISYRLTAQLPKRGPR